MASPKSKMDIRRGAGLTVAAPVPKLHTALADVRDHGRLRAAQILCGNGMLSADGFAKMLGASGVTVNTKRQSGQILGLHGAKRGFRFPVRQLDAEGDSYYADLSKPHELLGDLGR